MLNEAQIKSMTGNDTLNARFLHENSFDFKPQFKLYVNTNYLPAITDMTLFSSGRIVIVCKYKLSSGYYGYDTVFERTYRNYSL